MTRYQDDSGISSAAGIVLYTRPDGSRAALIGGVFDISYLPTSRVRMLNRIADRVIHISWYWFHGSRKTELYAV